jgi:hypothetical protein
MIIIYTFRRRTSIAHRSAWYNRTLVSTESHVYGQIRKALKHCILAA